MEITLLKLRKISLVNVFIPLMLYFVILSGLTDAQELHASHQLGTFPNTGPVVTVLCEATFPVGSTQPIVTLLFDDMELAVNGNQTINKPLKYRFDYFEALPIVVSKLSIRNALKQDEGLYQCQMNYMQGGNVQNISDTEYVIVNQYLPTLNYPGCSIEPSVELVYGDLATFNCSVGESNPPVNLTLALIRTDKPIQPIGYRYGYYNRNASVTLPVNATDNNTKLACYMTSDTFPTAYRGCYVGPITVLPSPLSSPTESQAIEHPNISTSSSSLEKTLSVSAGLIAGAAGGGLIVLILVVIIYLVIRRKSKSKNSSPTNKCDLQMNNVYSPKTDNDTEWYGLSPAQPSTIPGYGEYAYADVQNAGISAQSKSKASDTYHYADVSPSKPEGASNFPIYSQVNKSFKRDKSQNEAGESKDSGMVENIVYISAGPK